ncbi:hypothetical protein NIES4072_39700 [Nostoc commune NIES-4072]|uniref:Uncharacterized protein n=1 Tax=Nostoc commune NIES-4072 TaxID=2005467 RepID=A0A2R5FVP0_NOSCO|nr:hypothetical protein NIES4070_51070 [Nostoc commune HK-02]GBG20293.1 hypothetical protein NIES4072_39700 [Nostoc commune NIES-4072]
MLSIYTYNLYDLTLKHNEKYFDIFIKIVDIFRQYFKKLTDMFVSKCR